jgi:hypothetical protein
LVGLEEEAARMLEHRKSLAIMGLSLPLKLKSYGDERREL